MLSLCMMAFCYQCMQYPTKPIRMSWAAFKLHWVTTAPPIVISSHTPCLPHDHTMTPPVFQIHSRTWAYAAWCRPINFYPAPSSHFRTFVMHSSCSCWVLCALSLTHTHTYTHPSSPLSSVTPHIWFSSKHFKCSMLLINCSRWHLCNCRVKSDVKRDKEARARNTFEPD